MAFALQAVPCDECRSLARFKVAHLLLQAVLFFLHRRVISCLRTVVNAVVNGHHAQHQMHSQDGAGGTLVR